MTRIAASPQAEALVQMLEALSEATPGTPSQRAVRSEMVWRALRLSTEMYPLALSWNYALFLKRLDDSGLDKDQVKAAVALIFG